METTVETTVVLKFYKQLSSVVVSLYHGFLSVTVKIVLIDVLALYDPDIPTLFGAHYNKIVPGGTVSGGAGYLLSR